MQAAAGERRTGPLRRTMEGRGGAANERRALVQAAAGERRTGPLRRMGCRPPLYSSLLPPLPPPSATKKFPTGHVTDW